MRDGKTPASSMTSHSGSSGTRNLVVLRMSLLIYDQAKNKGGGVAGRLKGPVHPALAARRSREFNRADTDFLPTVLLEDDTCS